MSRRSFLFFWVQGFCFFASSTFITFPVMRDLREPIGAGACAACVLNSLPFSLSPLFFSEQRERVCRGIGFRTIGVLFLFHKSTPIYIAHAADDLSKASQCDWLMPLYRLYLYYCTVLSTLIRRVWTPLYMVTL